MSCACACAFTDLAVSRTSATAMACDVRLKAFCGELHLDWTPSWCGKITHISRLVRPVWLPRMFPHLAEAFNLLLQRSQVQVREGRSQAVETARNMQKARSNRAPSHTPTAPSTQLLHAKPYIPGRASGRRAIRRHFTLSCPDILSKKLLHFRFVLAINYSRAASTRVHRETAQITPELAFHSSHGKRDKAQLIDLV